MGGEKLMFSNWCHHILTETRKDEGEIIPGVILPDDFTLIRPLDEVVCGQNV